MDLGEFEFELSDVDVAAFESVATEDPIQEQQQQHQQQQQQQGSLPQETQVSSAPQQPSTQPLEFQLGQQHQLQTIVSAATTASAASHQATVPTSSNPATSTSRILLVPINSKQGAISGYKQLYQLTTGSSPIATLTAAGNKKQIIQLAPISALTLNNAVTKSISASNNNLNNSISSQLSTNTTATNLNSSTKFNLSYNNSNNNNNNITNDNLRAPTPNSTAPNEVPKRKPCNCTKSQCLKLYCDCFANGEFCSGCNCTNCFNSLSKEKERQKAISQCLERNPEAFRPKIGKAVKAMIGEPAPESIERRHTKGCNCKRSGCLKNYCECYEAKILCSNLCKCCGCKNYEESFERKSLMQLANSASENARGILKNLLPTNTNSNNGKDFTKCFITDKVIHASLVCLLQSAQQAEKDGVSAGNVPNLIQSEMGKCLRMIVDSANETSNPKKR